MDKGVGLTKPVRDSSGPISENGTGVRIPYTTWKVLKKDGYVIKSKVLLVKTNSGMDTGQQTIHVFTLYLGST